MKTMIRITLPLLLILFTVNIHAQDTPEYDQPILVSSAGQSADVKLAGLLLKKNKLESKTVLMAKPADLEGMKTLVVVPGFSSKGLGAAGISAEEEMERVHGLLAKAEELKVPVILLHIGGKARRKGQSDNFIKEVAQKAVHMIVVEQGNEDGLFTKLAEERNIPLVLVKKIPNASQPLGKLFE